MRLPPSWSPALRLAAASGLLALASALGAQPFRDPPASPDTGAGTIRLGLDQALRLAESSNLTVMIQRETVTQAIEAKVRSRADLLPGLTARAAQTRSRSGGESSDGRDFSTTSNRFSAQLNASSIVVDAERIANFYAAKKAEEVARIDFEDGVQTVLDSVATLFLTHVRNLARLDLNQANIDRARVLLDLAQSQLSAGVATQIDVTRAEAALATQEQSLIQQQTVVFTSEQQLKRALDLPVETALEVERFSAQRALDETLLRLDTGMVLDQRNDFRSARTQLEQNRLERRASRLQRTPSISLDASVGYQSDTPFDGDEENFWSIGASVSVPIFDGFRIESNRRLADSRIRAQEITVQNLQRQIRDELRIALRDAQSRLAQIAVAEKNAALAAEELRLARIRFEQGVADNREIVDAQNNLAEANDNLVEAVYQYDLSRLELARVRGDVRLLLAERGN